MQTESVNNKIAPTASFSGPTDVHTPVTAATISVRPEKLKVSLYITKHVHYVDTKYNIVMYVYDYLRL